MKFREKRSEFFVINPHTSSHHFKFIENFIDSINGAKRLLSHLFLKERRDDSPQNHSAFNCLTIQICP